MIPDATIDTPLHPLYTRADVSLRTVAVSERRFSMRAPQANGWTRRRFLDGLPVVGTAGLLGWRPQWVAAEPPPETTTLRLHKRVNLCIAPQYVVEEFLQREGFTTARDVETGLSGAAYQALAAGEIDLTLSCVGPSIMRVDAGDPLVFLAGAHAGCFELFGTDQVRAIRDLKGKTVAVPERGGPQHVFLSSMAAYVGLDPSKDITWVTHPRAESMQ
jgi:NitT/TauT family transport system substrate-binding protein